MKWPSSSGANTRDAILIRAGQLFGSVPPVIDDMTRNLAVANAYLSALDALEHGVLTASERYGIMLAVSAANNAADCVDVQRIMALQANVHPADVDLMTVRQPPRDARLQTLTQVTRLLREKHGRLDLADIQVLHQNGVERRQIYEVIAIIGINTISDYIHHIRTDGTQTGNEVPTRS